jgi:hypothetical protein
MALSLGSNTTIENCRWFLSHGSIWQLLGEVSVSEEDTVTSEETRSLTESESRHADACVGSVENISDGNGKSVNDQCWKESQESLRGIRRSLEERREQWVNRRVRGFGPLVTVEKCVNKMMDGEMSETEARNAMACFDIDEEFRFWRLMGFTQTHETAFRGVAGIGTREVHEFGPG